MPVDNKNKHLAKSEKFNSKVLPRYRPIAVRGRKTSFTPAQVLTMATALSSIVPATNCCETPLVREERSLGGSKSYVGGGNALGLHPIVPLNCKSQPSRYAVPQQCSTNGYTVSGRIPFVDGGTGSVHFSLDSTDMKYLCKRSKNNKIICKGRSEISDCYSKADDVVGKGTFGPDLIKDMHPFRHACDSSAIIRYGDEFKIRADIELDLGNFGDTIILQAHGLSDKRLARDTRTGTLSVFNGDEKEYANKLHTAEFENNGNPPLALHTVEHNGEQMLFLRLVSSFNEFTDPKTDNCKLSFNTKNPKIGVPDGSKVYNADGSLGSTCSNVYLGTVGKDIPTRFTVSINGRSTSPNYPIRSRRKCSDNGIIGFVGVDIEYDVLDPHKGTMVHMARNIVPVVSVDFGRNDDQSRGGIDGMYVAHGIYAPNHDGRNTKVTFHDFAVSSSKIREELYKHKIKHLKKDCGFARR